MRPFIAALIGGPALRCMQPCTVFSLGQQEEGRGEAALVKLPALDHNLVPFPFFQTIFCFLINPINRPKSFVCIHFVNCSQN